MWNLVNIPVICGNTYAKYSIIGVVAMVVIHRQVYVRLYDPELCEQEAVKIGNVYVVETVNSDSSMRVMRVPFPSFGHLREACGEAEGVRLRGYSTEVG